MEHFNCASTIAGRSRCVCVHVPTHTGLEKEKQKIQYHHIYYEVVFHYFNMYKGIKAMPGMKRSNNINVLHPTSKIAFI